MPPVKFGLPAVDQKTYDDYVDDSFEKQTGADIESLAQVSQQRAKVDDEALAAFDRQADADIASIASVRQAEEETFLGRMDADIASITAGGRYGQAASAGGGGGPQDAPPRGSSDGLGLELAAGTGRGSHGSQGGPPGAGAAAGGTDPLDRAFGDLGPQAVANMKAIMQKESGGRADAVKNDAIEDSRGRLQINARAHPELAAKYDLLDPEQNAMAAREVYNRQGYKAWYTASKQLGLLDGGDATGRNDGGNAQRPYQGASDVPGQGSAQRPEAVSAQRTIGAGWSDDAQRTIGADVGRDVGPDVPRRLGPVEAVSQFAAGLPDEEAWAACGPVAALAFAQANGRNPTLKEAVALARETGWTAAGGMNGVANQKALLDRMGVASRLETAPDFGQIAQDAESGNPVIVSTPKHYYYVNGYDKATGRLHVGKTGEARKGGGSWMSAQQIAELDGGINGALFVDNPNTPTPSVAAGGPAPVGEPAEPSTYDDGWNDQPQAPPSTYDDGWNNQPEAPAPPAVGGSFGTPQAKVRGILNQLGDAILDLVGKGGQAAENLGQAAGNAVARIPGGTFDPLDPVNKGVLPLPLPSGREAVDWARSSGRQMVEQFGSENEAIGRAFRPGSTDADWQAANDAGLNAAMTLGPESLRRAGTAAAGAAGRRMFHGTGNSFPKPDPEQFDPNGLYGPGYYLTSDARVADSYAVERGKQSVEYARNLSEGIRTQRAIAADPSLPAAERQRATTIADGYDSLLADIKEGPNVRPVDVPEGIRLLDAEKRFMGEGVFAPIKAAAEWEGIDMSALSPNVSGNEVWQHLAGKVGSAGATRVLAAAGYDGITYAGGRRIPIKDDSGAPIEHDAYVIFPAALPKVRNALTGQPGGQIDARYAIDAGAAAAGGTAGYLTAPEDATTAERWGRAALGAAGGFGASRIGQAALSPEAMARTRRLGITPGGGDAAARPLPRPVQEVVDAYKRVTPPRVEAIHRRTMQILNEQFNFTKRPEVERLLRDTFDRLQAELPTTKVVSTALGEEQIAQLVSEGRIQSKFGAITDEAEMAKVTQRRVGKTKGKWRIDREGAREFSEIEARADRAALGSSEHLGRDPDAVPRLYARVSEGEPLIDEGRQLVHVVWDEATPRVTTLHHHFGLVEPNYKAHTTMRPEFQKLLWNDPKGDPIPLGDAKSLMDTPWLVGPEGEDALRSSNLLMTMPNEVRDMVRRGDIADADALSAVLLRGEKRQDQPLGKKTPLAASRNANRTESLVVDPSPENIKALYVVGTPSDLTQVRKRPPTGMPKLNVAPYEAALNLQSAIRERTGRDVPIYAKELGKGESKLIPSELAPGRAGIVDRYTKAGLEDIGQIDARYAMDAGAAAAGGAAGYATSDEDATIGERIGRTVLGAAGGLGASRIGQAALSPGAMADTARLGIRGGTKQTTQLALPLSVPGGPPHSTVYDKVSVVRMAGMLSGTGTQLLNAASNAIVGGSTLAFKLGQVALDAGASKLTGKERERYLAEFGPQLRGYGAGAWAGMQQVPGILKGRLPEGTLEKLDARGFRSGNKMVDAAVEMPLRILSASDAVFRGASFGGHAGALATRQAIKEGLDGGARRARADEILDNLTEHPNILDEANRLAARDVLQEQRGVTKALSEARRGGGVTGKALDVFLPFSTSPYNAAAQGAGMTPAGYAAALKAARDGNTGEAIDRAVRATAGTLGLVTGIQMAANGYITGAYPEDANDRSTLPEGWKPYAVRIPKDDGAVYVPLQMLGNLAVPLGLAAIYAEAQAKGASDADLNKTVFRVLKGVGGYVLDTSAMQGLTAIGELVRQPERQFERFTESLTSSYVPYSALGRQVNQAFGVAQRDPEGALEAFVAAIPGLSGNVREKITPLGSPRRIEPPGPMALVTGSRIGVEKDEPTLRVLRDARVSIPPPPKEVKNIRLTEAEGRMFQEIAGRHLRELIEPLENDPEYLDLSPAGREKILTKIRDNARKWATAEVIESIEADEISRRKQKDRDARDARQPLLSLREGNR